MFDEQTRGIARVSGSEAIAQTIRNRLLLLQGEWFMATEQGMPWFTELTGRSVSYEKVRSYVTTTVLKTWGVEELISIDIAKTSRDRKMLIQFSYRDVYGTIIELRI